MSSGSLIAQLDAFEQAALAAIRGAADAAALEAARIEFLGARQGKLAYIRAALTQNGAER